MEWTEVNLFCDFIQLRLFAEMLADKPDGHFDTLIVIHTQM
jgi:hypothetical protein